MSIESALAKQYFLDPLVPKNLLDFNRFEVLKKNMDEVLSFF